MLKFKNSARIVALATVLVFMMSTLAMAAIPPNAIIFGGKAYDVSLLNDSSLASQILADFVANGNSFVYKTPAGTLVDANAAAVAPATLKEVLYTAQNKTTTTYEKGDGPVKGGSTIPDPPVAQSSITITPSVTERVIVPGGYTQPIEIAAQLVNFPANVEATIAFSASWGQISQVETTAGQKVTVKLYPEDTTKTQVVTVRAEVVKARNVVTGEVKDDWKNVPVAPTVVTFKVTGSDAVGKVFKVNSAVATQADRVTLVFNDALSADAVKILTDVKNLGKIMVYDNLGDAANKVIPAAGNKCIGVQNVIKSGDNSLLLVLDRKDANFPLTDNAKHRVVIDMEQAAPFVKIMGSADFFLEDSSYLKLMKVYTRANAERTDLDYNQIEVQFSEAVNDLPAFASSVANPQNWVIDGLNLATQLPSKVPADVVITTKDTDKSIVARETVLITLKNAKDYSEFLKPGLHKLQVNSSGDWASATDAANIVATQELQYDGIALPPVSVSWVMDGKPVVDSTTVLADGKDESPEQFIVTFNVPVSDATVANSFNDNFEIIVPDNSKVNPYVNCKWKLLADNSAAPALLSFSVNKITDTKYMIELNNDWTKIYDTAATKDNYHDTRYNPLRLVVKNFQDLYGRAVEDTLAANAKVATNTIKLVEDTQSPYTTTKKQLTFAKGVKEDADITQDAGAVYIEMNEPCQYRDKFSNAIDNTILTPSQQQQGKGGVDINTFEYVMLKDVKGVAPAAAKTIEGKIVALLPTGPATLPNSIEACRDFAIEVEPVSALESGEWKLVIRAISDDVGNTMATEEMPITINPTGNKLTILGIDAHHTVVNDNNPAFAGRNWLTEYAADKENTNDAADIIHVLFNKDLKLVGDYSALNKMNWRLDGEPLPIDGTRIQRGILGEANALTIKSGVTIILPDGYLLEKDVEHVLTLINIEPEVQVDATDRVNDRLQVPYLDLHKALGPVVPPDPGVPAVKSFNNTNASLEIGKQMVIVELDTATPEKYTVACKGVDLPLKAGTNKFVGNVAKDDAIQANVVVTAKPVVKMPDIKSFNNTNASLEIGKQMVIVELDTTTPEKYTVTCKGVDLPLKAGTNKFVGNVAKDDAIQANVVVSAK